MVEPWPISLFTWPSASTARAKKSCWGYGIAKTEGARFWLSVMTKLKNSGLGAWATGHRHRPLRWPERLS
ncbi:transposase [Arsenophonus endosymbiont of Aleurodicus floccissimus]|uniref:transposase n=1 Tax=Arsenophonus endosymbiont of Aleurodicus floccissimus TaxID=2152761 RepID=UPI001EDE7600|nr:transposase [Arsenophonus endosymbiont of Aleurodicus floccissimus]